jgi:hypothetical protein
MGGIATTGRAGVSNMRQELGLEVTNAAARCTTDGVAVFVIDFHADTGGCRTAAGNRRNSH